MRFLNKFNAFLINENILVPKKEIKELFEDFFLEMIDYSFVDSILIIDSYIDENGDSSSEITRGSLPLYRYELKLNSIYKMSDIRNIIHRIKKYHLDFKIRRVSARNTEELYNDDIDEETTITIFFVYMKNKKFEISDDLKRIMEILDSKGYQIDEVRFSRKYIWKKTIVDKEIEMPPDWFSKLRRHGVYNPLASKTDLVINKLNEAFIDDIKKEFKILKDNIFGEIEDLKPSHNGFSSHFNKFGFNFSINFSIDPNRISIDNKYEKYELYVSIYLE